MKFSLIICKLFLWIYNIEYFAGTNFRELAFFKLFARTYIRKFGQNSRNLILVKIYTLKVLSINPQKKPDGGHSWKLILTET